MQGNQKLQILDAAAQSPSQLHPPLPLSENLVTFLGVECQKFWGAEAGGGADVVRVLQLQLSSWQQAASTCLTPYCLPGQAAC